jgi:hypothetical protein
MKSNGEVPSNMDDLVRVGAWSVVGKRLFDKSPSKKAAKRNSSRTRTKTKKPIYKNATSIVAPSDIHERFWGNPKLRIDDWMAGNSGIEREFFPHILKSEIPILSEEALEDFAASNISIERYANQADEDSQMSQIYWTGIGMGCSDSDALLIGRF